MSVLSFSCTKQTLISFVPTSFNYVYKINYESAFISSFDKPLVLGVDNIPKNLNPLRASDYAQKLLVNAMYGTLVRRRIDGSGFGYHLIDSFQVQDDGRKLYFRLRENVVFVDGTGEEAGELTAYDVAATIDLIKKYLKNAPIYNRLHFNNKVMLTQIISRYEFYILIDKPNPNLFYALSEMPILRAADCENVGTFKDFILSWGSDSILPGTGPYLCKKITKNEIVLAPNRRYFAGQSKTHKNFVIRASRSGSNLGQMFIGREADIVPCDSLDALRSVYNYIDKNENNCKIIDNDFGRIVSVVKFNRNAHFYGNQQIRQMIRDSLYLKMRQVTHARVGLNSSFEADENVADLSRFGLKFRLICSDDLYDASLPSKLKNALTRLGIDCSLEVLPHYMYMQKYIKGDYDIALVESILDDSPYGLYEFLSGLDNLPRDFFENAMFGTVDTGTVNAEIQNIKKSIDESVIFAGVFLNRQYYFISDKVDCFPNQRSSNVLSSYVFE